MQDRHDAELCDPTSCALCVEEAVVDSMFDQEAYERGILEFGDWMMERV